MHRIIEMTAQEMAEYFDVGTEAKEDKVFTIAGFPLPASVLTTTRSLEKALTLRPQPNDVILSSYPKCDSKCIEAIVWKLLYMDLKHPPINSLTNRFLPCIEMENIDDMANAYDHMIKHKLPRLYKTYLPFKLIPFYKRVKYIYVIRTPWEACVSYYNFLLKLDAVADPFDEFLNDFLRGNVAYGSYFKHIMPWNKRINESNVLILCHEHVEHNPRSAMFIIAAFLGDRYLTQLMNNSEIEDSILKATNWDKSKGVSRYMPKSYLTESLTNELNDLSCNSEDHEVKSSRPTCSEMQLRVITEKVTEHFRDSSIEFLWLNLLKKQSPVLFS